MEYRIGKIGTLLNIADNHKINNCWLLVYIRKGAGMYNRRGHMYGLNEGEILFFPPWSEIAFDSTTLGDEYNANLDATVIRFDEQWLDAFLRLFPSHSLIVLSIKECRVPSRILGTKWLTVSRMMDRLASSEPHKHAAIVLDILELLADPAGVEPIADAAPATVYDISDRIERIDRFISCNLVRKFSLEEIARYVGMNRTYFCLFFKKHYGVSLTDHVNALRIDMACTLLRQDEISISDVARMCGFPTVTYFNRVFKKIKGVSPRDL